MFDIFPKLLSSIASFLFPVFASYKALKTSDPAELTPWLMYWVVFSCALLVESWADWFLVWIPFYSYIRLLFLLYLVLPQTQGARILYQTYLHPWLEENEGEIEKFIASAHERLRSAGIAYLKRAIDLLRMHVFGLPPGEPEPAPATATGVPPQSYTQSLLARFSLPSARWPANPAAGGATDFYSLLAGAVSAVASGPATARTPRDPNGDLSASGTLIPPNIRESDRATFLATQRERLNTLLGALDREAAQLGAAGGPAAENAAAGTGGARSRFGNPWAAAGGDGTPAAAAEERERPASELSKSRSEADFEKIDAESGAEEPGLDGGLRRRGGGGGGGGVTPSVSSGGWMPWPFGGGGEGTSTGAEK